MKTIWKYPLEVGRINKIKLQSDRSLAYVGMDPQTGNPCLWFILNPRGPEEISTYYVYGTGWEIPETSIHVGTVIIGAFVWHVFKEVTQ